MRRGHVLAVSSATLFLSTMFAPCHHSHASCGASLADTETHGVLVSEFYPCGLCDDEYFVIENCRDAVLSLRNWTVTDGEGSLRLIGAFELPSGSRLTVSSNSTSYKRAYGVLPDIGIDQPGSELLVSREGTFRLADTGDSISLRGEDGLEVDFVVYGSCADDSLGWTGDPVPTLRRGEVAKRLRANGRSLDSDTMADWLHFREHKYGYTDFPSPSATVGPGLVKAFVSPDCGLGAVTEAILSATSAIRICAYELSSVPVCCALLSAIASGIEVRVLVDGAPAGGMDESEVISLSALVVAGGSVKVLIGNISRDTVQHVGPLHAKYVVIDDRSFVVLSENLVESGLPSNPLSGNRGWGLAVSSPELAIYLGRLFDEDARPSRDDVRDWRQDTRFRPGSVLPDAPPIATAAGVIRPKTSSFSSVVTLLVSPDASPREPFLCDVICNSKEILVEQFQADLLWRDRWTGESSISPLIAAAETALGAGAEASMLFDSVWFNLEDNSEVVEHLNSFAAKGGLRGEARLMDLSGPVSTLHNKGLVSDGLATLVSSNNWVRSSFAGNRELAVLVRSSELAEYFIAVFELDWEPDGEAPTADAGPDFRLSVGESAVIDGSGSTDDRAIVRWQWRLEGDGKLIDLGQKATFLASRPGKHTVHLLVQDAWGNTAVDSVTVEVVAATAGFAGPGTSWLMLATVLLAALSCAAGAAAARKVNHRNRSSR